MNSPEATRFHQVHGKDVILYGGQTKANRRETKHNGLLFTSKPVKPNEKIAVKLLRVSDELSEIIRIGFTSLDPSTVKYSLPGSSKDVKTKSGFWLCSPPREVCVRNKTLFFYVTSFGKIYYGSDEEEKGSFDVKVDTQRLSWAVIDILTPQTIIQIVPLNQRNLLHPNCSRKIKISQNIIRKIAREVDSSCVFTSKPIKFNEKVVVKMLGAGNITFGVTLCNPDYMSALHIPTNSASLLEWSVIKEPSWNFKQNDELSYVISEKGSMEIRKNGSQILKNVAVKCTSQMWGFFSLGTVRGVEIWTTKLGASTTCKENDEPLNKTSVPESLNDSDCCICFEKARDTALYPCGHMCTCFDCGEKQWRRVGGGCCPICRKPIIDVLKIYK